MLETDGDRAGQPVPPLQVGELAEIAVGERHEFGRKPRGLRLLDVLPREAERAEPEVEDAELEPDHAELRIEEEHPLERGDRGLVVADRDRRPGIAQRQVGISGIAQHLLGERVEFLPRRCRTLRLRRGQGGARHQKS
jgi:hypothetical protein